MQQSVFAVTGMTCGHCENAVRAEISRIPGVRDVSVELGTGAVTVGSDAELDPAAVRAAVEEAGYQLAG
jgi:copper chaperone